MSRTYASIPFVRKNHRQKTSRRLEARAGGHVALKSRQTVRRIVDGRGICGRFCDSRWLGCLRFDIAGSKCCERRKKSKAQQPGARHDVTSRQRQEQNEHRNNVSVKLQQTLHTIISKSRVNLNHIAPVPPPALRQRAPPAWKAGRGGVRWLR